MEKNSKQKEELARRLAKDEKKEDIIKANAFLINLNAPETGYYYKRTSIASK